MAVLFQFLHFRSSYQRRSIIKGLLKISKKFTGKQLCWSLFFKPQASNFIKKLTLKLVFSCDFCENFRSSRPLAF